MKKKIAKLLILSQLLLVVGCSTKKPEPIVTPSSPEPQVTSPATTNRQEKGKMDFAVDSMNTYEASEVMGDFYEPFIEYNTEEYSSEEENRFMSVKSSPFSTFAADVDTASYANIRRMLLDGDTVVPSAVRIEEMVNYFNYDLPEPSDNAPFSVTTEVSKCP